MSGSLDTAPDVTARSGPIEEQPVAARTGRPGRSVARVFVDVGLGLVVPLVGVAAWELLARAGVTSPILYSSPSAIAKSAVTLAQNGQLGRAILASVTLWFSGLVIGGVAGVVFGYLVGLSRRIGETLQFTLLLMQVVPSLALIPLFIIWFGGGNPTRVLIVTLAVFFPVYINTVTGIRGTDPRLVEVARTLGLGRARIVGTVIAPSALPLVFVGLRQSLKFGWVGVVGVEFFVAASSGLAFMLSQARSFSQTAVVILSILLLALLGILTDVLIRVVERAVVRPRPAALAVARPRRRKRGSR